MYFKNKSQGINIQSEDGDSADGQMGLRVKFNWFRNDIDRSRWKLGWKTTDSRSFCTLKVKYSVRNTNVQREPMLKIFSGLKGLSAFKYTAISGAATTLVVTYTCVAFFNFVFTSYTYGKYSSIHVSLNFIMILAKFRREVNPDMPEQLYINNLCDTNRNLSFYKEYIHERSEILCGLSVTCINLFNGIILLLACCLDCKESLFNDALGLRVSETTFTFLNSNPSQ